MSSGASITVDGKVIQPSQYGDDYISEFNRILRTYVTMTTGNLLEWGAGHTTAALVEFCDENACKLLVSVDHNGKYLESVAQPFRSRSYFQAKLLSEAGPCVNDRDQGSNYSSYPLSLGVKFDFVYIDGRRRVECAFITSLLSHARTIVVLHDYRRARYQAVCTLYEDIETGPQFRVMRPRMGLVEEIQKNYSFLFAVL